MGDAAGGGIVEMGCNGEATRSAQEVSGQGYGGRAIRSVGQDMQVSTWMLSRAISMRDYRLSESPRDSGE
jgi:hypothetical protein